jgi:hypothetical protein
MVDLVQQSSYISEHVQAFITQAVSTIVRQHLPVMTEIMPMGTVGLAHIGEFSRVAPRYLSDHRDEYEATLEGIIEHISDAGKDSYRSDMISDVNAGLGVMATGIRLISAILTLLGGTQNMR